MTTPGTRTALSLLLLAACAAPPEPASDAPRRPPNIVYVLADDLGYGDVACNAPDGRIATPHLDRLAADGLRFTDAHSGSAVCSPTRYGVLTGRYAWRSRLQSGVLGGSSEHLIDPARPTVASLLADAGYATAMIGKWHLGWDFQRAMVAGVDPDTMSSHPGIDFGAPVTNGPDANGFEHYFGICGSLDMAPYVYVEDGRITAAPNRITKGEGKRFWREGPTGADFFHEEVQENLVRRGVRFVEESAAAGRPFFLYLPLAAPHTPILPTGEFLGRSGTNEYGDFVQQVDHGVGALLAALERAGVADDTLFIFTSDNGCSPMADFEELAAVGHDPSAGWRGHKADIYEGGHRVPFLARWPARVAPGTTSDETICLTDLFATAAALVGAEVPPDAAEDSVSLAPVLLGEARDGPLREATVHHSINGSFALRQGRWKLILCPGSGGWSAPRPGAAWADAALPLVQLYDLEADPGEEANVQAQHPAVVAELTALLERYVREGRSTPGPAQENDVEVRLVKRSRG